MRFYSDGIDYHVEVHQSDRNLPYLILFHGFMGAGSAFRHLTGPLMQFCNPVTIDLAGHGKTVTPVDPELFSAKRQTGQIASILNRLSFENLFAYGYSMGGRLLFQLITGHPELVRGAVVESSHCGIDSETDRKLRIETDKKRSAFILEDFNTFVDQWSKMPLFLNPDSDLSRDQTKLMKNQKPKLMAASLSGFGAGIMPSVCKKLQNLNLPLYLVAGKQDIKYSKMIPELAETCNHCSYTIVENAGHRVHLNQPNELIKIIQSFIKNHHV